METAKKTADYPTLQKLSYRESEAGAHAVYKQRFGSPAAVHLPISIGNFPIFYCVTPELLRMSETIYANESELHTTLRQFSQIALSSLTDSLVIDEIVASNDIENIHSSRKEVADALRAGGHSRKRLAPMAELVRALARGGALAEMNSVEDVRALFDLVTAGELDPADVPDGVYFRKGHVEIVASSQKMLHRGFYPEAAIIEGVEVMLEEWRTPSSSKLNAAILAHLIFEIVHPFYDGNGRTGRYILIRYLAQLLSFPTALSMSRLILEHRGAYYQQFKSLEDPRNKAEATHFLLFFLELIAQAQSEMIARLSDKREQLDNAVRNIRQLSIDKTFSSTSLNDRSHSTTASGSNSFISDTANVLIVLAQQYLFDVPQGLGWDTLAHELGKSKATIRKIISRLEYAGYLSYTQRKPLVVQLSELAVTKIFGEQK